MVRYFLIVARWHIGARFGHEPPVIDSLKTWSREIGSQIGWTKDKVRIATGSIGALESTVEMGILVQDLIPEITKVLTETKPQ